MASLSNFFKPPSPPQPAATATTTPSFESLESSIHDVMNLYKRRRKWRTLFAAPNLNNIDASTPWRAHLITFLESTLTHGITLVLLLMDLIITVLELSSSLISCGSPASPRGEEKEVLYFHWVGITILSLLSVKMVALMVGLGRSFFNRPCCVVDGVVVVVALVLEVAVERKGGGVIMVASLWRLVRVVESAFELSDDAIEGKIEGIVWELERMKEEIRREKEKDEVIEML